MASQSYPRPGHNSGRLTTVEHENLIRTAIGDGVDGHPTDSAPVYADGTGVRVVRVRSHKTAWNRGSFWDSGDTDIALPSLAANESGHPRIDLVVLRLDRATYEVIEYVITGSPGPNPVAPAYTQDWGDTGYWDLPLAQARVDHGATSLPADAITTRCWYRGTDGQILCTVNTRPPHELGRVIVETDTGRVMVSNGSQWQVVHDDSGPTFLHLNSTLFVSNGHYNLHRRHGLVWANLTAARPGGALSANTIYHVATVPVGFRPNVLIQGLATVTGSVYTATFTINPNDGWIRVNPGSRSIPAGKSLIFALGAWTTA